MRKLFWTSSLPACEVALQNFNGYRQRTQRTHDGTAPTPHKERSLGTRFLHVENEFFLGDVAIVVGVDLTEGSAEAG